MSALKKETKMVVPRRPKDVVRARPALGSHQEQVDNAFAIAFERYEKAFEELAKV
ncbi:hypothetical protein ACRS3X_25395 [Ectopseudomonas hydrolytica]|uniref:hypothetical protein n=1 Tax=Ectopseudomonas hydrolytica TaxID=2493633 RepID=UPI003EE199FB